MSTKLLFRFVEWMLDHPTMAARTSKAEQENMVGLRNHLAGKEMVVVLGGVGWCWVVLGGVGCWVVVGWWLYTSVVS